MSNDVCSGLDNNGMTLLGTSKVLHAHDDVEISPRGTCKVLHSHDHIGMTLPGTCKVPSVSSSFLSYYYYCVGTSLIKHRLAYPYFVSKKEVKLVNRF